MRTPALLLTAFLASILFVGCCLPPRYEIAELPDEPDTFIELLKIENHVEPADDDSVWDVHLRFYEKTKYPHMIQIIWLDQGSVLVEGFRMEEGRQGWCRYDHHSSTGYGIRKMLVYPGIIVGAEWTPNGFCQVTRSEAGDVTNIGKNFNSDYQKKYATTGYVLEGDRSLGFEWSIDAKPEGVEVFSPPEHTLQPK